jgi:hypothetical protein
MYRGTYESRSAITPNMMTGFGVEGVPQEGWGDGRIDEESVGDCGADRRGS